MANTVTNANANKPLPQLDARYTDQNALQKQTAAAQKTAASIDTFYQGQYSKDYQTLQSNAQHGITDPQAEVKFAADVALLQSMEKQHATDNNDQATVDRLTNNPDQTTEGVTTNQLLESSGSTHTKDTDFVFTGSGTQANQQIDAHLKDDPSVQGTAAFTTGGDGVNASTSSKGKGEDWSLSSSSGASMSGGRYDAADGKQMYEQMKNQGTVTVDNSQSMTARQRSDVFTYMKTLPNADVQSQTQNHAGLQALWQKGSSANFSVADLTTNTDAFNQLTKLMA